MTQQEQLLKLMFNEGETFCPSPNKYAYHSVGMDSFIKNEVELISPNPKYKPETIPFSSITHLALNPINGFRCDENVYKFRSFLIELDADTIENQIAYIKTMKMPYSAMVWSGSKSVHTLITLDQDLGSLDTYKYIAKWLLSIMSKADQQTTPPSRCIRMPGAIRPETGNKQILLEIKNRISLDDLYSFLAKHKNKKPKVEVKREFESFPTGKIPYWVQKALYNVNDYAAKKGYGRNNTWFRIFLDLGKSGMSEDQAISHAERHFEAERDFRKQEWLGVAESAFKKLNRRRG